MSKRAVECECGLVLPVPGEACGPLSCSCGRRVIVPLPEEFDGRSVLISATTVERRVRRMIAAGELPSTRECACCGSMNAEALDLRLVCEVERSRVTGGFRLLYIPGLFWMAWEEEERIETLGRENTVPVPVQVCGACAEGFKEPALSRWAYLFAAAAAVVPAAVVWPSSAPLGVLCGVLAFGLLLIGIASRGRRDAARRQRACKAVLSGVTIYNQLLDEYPHSTVLLPVWVWVEDGPR